METATPDVLNSAFERQSFGHRSLVHAHICDRHWLWGVLQPCLMTQPRHWTEAEQAGIHQLVQLVHLFVLEYVKSRHGERLENHPLD